MNFLTTLLYWISTGMMIPVIVLTLIALGWSLLLLGDLYGTYSTRVKLSKKRKGVIAIAGDSKVGQLDFHGIIKGKGLYQSHLSALIACRWDRLAGEKVLSDFELAAKKAMRVPIALMRTGPMLGLMGTLIPMGPALAGLASGDISSMATNMQVAFSTTVVGVFIGGVGFIVQLAYNYWHHCDYSDLAYLFELSQEQQADEQAEKKTLCA